MDAAVVAICNGWNLDFVRIFHISKYIFEGKMAINIGFKYLWNK